MDPDHNSPEEEEKMYILLGKLFTHYCAEKGVPASPIAFKKMIPDMIQKFSATEEEIKQAFVFLNEKAIELGFGDEKRVQIGFNAKTESK